MTSTHMQARQPARTNTVMCMTRWCGGSRRPTVLATWHTGGQNSEKGLDAGCRGHSWKGAHRQQHARECLLLSLSMWVADFRTMWMTRPTFVMAQDIAVDGSSSFSQCEARTWNQTKAVSRIINGFNSRCMHVIIELHSIVRINN